MRRIPRPLCACGCGLPVRRHFHRWINNHVPSELRALGGSKARREFAFKQRSARYRGEIVKALNGRKSLKHEDLLALCEAVYRRGFQSGYATSDTKWRRVSATEAA